MNIKNNKRRRASREKIEAAFIEALQTKELSQITVADLCKTTGLNRSTFYANYEDIYALADVLMARLEQEVSTIFGGNIADNGSAEHYLRLFHHIRDNQLFYKTYFKLGYDHLHAPNLDTLDEATLPFSAAHIPYHVAFHRSGLNAIIKLWLQGGCRETPEELNDILKNEYRARPVV